MKKIILAFILLSGLNSKSQESITWKNKSISDDTSKILYVGIENKIAIETNRIDSTLFLFSKDSKIIYQKYNNLFSIFPKNQPEIAKYMIFACRLEGKDTILVDSATYSVRQTYSSWSPQLGDISLPWADKSEILRQTKVVATQSDKNITLKFQIFNYTLIIIHGQEVKKFEIEGDTLTQEVMNYFQKLENGDLIILYQVKGEPEPYNSATRSLPNFVITVL